MFSWQILLDKQWRRAPLVDHRANLAPIGVATLRENEDDRTPIIRQVRLVSFRPRRKVCVVKHREVSDGLVCRIIFLARFVVHHRHLESIPRSGLLHFSIGAVDEGFSVAVPVDHERSNSHRFR